MSANLISTSDVVGDHMLVLVCGVQTYHLTLILNILRQSDVVFTYSKNRTTSVAISVVIITAHTAAILTLHKNVIILLLFVLFPDFFVSRFFCFFLYNHLKIKI